jgi:hypothetical protein
MPCWTSPPDGVFLAVNHIHLPCHLLQKHSIMRSNRVFQT